MAEQLKVRPRTFGAHTHVRLFMAPSPDATFHSLGVLIMSPNEWELLEAMLRAGAINFPDDVQLTIEDERQEP